MEIVGVSSTGSQNVPIVFAPGGQHSPLPNPMHNMPAAAFVAGAAVAKASQAADIAHRAAHAAEHYYNESQQAQALAHTIHDHAVQREQQFQQAAAVLRGEAEGMVLESRAQAEAVAQQAKEFVANREREVEHQARQWASSQEAAMHQQVHGLSQQAHHVLGEKQAEIDHLRQENLRLAQELQAKALAVPIPPASVRSEAMPDVVHVVPSSVKQESIQGGSAASGSKQPQAVSQGPEYDIVQQYEALEVPPGLSPSLALAIPKSFQAEHVPIHTPSNAGDLQVQQQNDILQQQVHSLQDTVRMLTSQLQLVLQSSAPQPPPPPPGRPPSGSPPRVPPIPNFSGTAASSSGYIAPPPGSPPSSSSSSSSSTSSESPDSRGSIKGKGLCRICGGNHKDIDCPFLSMNKDSEVDFAEQEENIVRVKALNDLSLPQPPADAGQVRGYINQSLMAIGKLQKTSGSELYQWAQQCLDLDEEALIADLRFPRTSREIAAKLLKTCKTGKFGLLFQRMVEESRKKDGSMPNGRVMLRAIFKHFQLERDRIGMLGERNLLSLKMSGQKVNDLFNFRERYQYIMMAIPHEDLPREATLYNHLLDELEKFTLLHEKVVKSREAPVGSSRRTTKWLWEKVDLLIELDQNRTNRAAFDKKLQGNPHDIAVTAAPAAAGKTKEKKKETDSKTKSKSEKPKKEKKTKEKESQPNKSSTPRNTPRQGKTEATAAPAQTSKGGKQQQNKGDKKGKSGSLTPRSAAVKKAQDMTPQEKAKTPCIFFPFNACKATKCEFLHDKNDLYKGPPPRSVRFSGSSAAAKDKVSANVAVVQPIFATPAIHENRVSWLWDTAAGRHLFGKQALTPSMKHCLSPSKNPVNFTTGGVANKALIH